MKMLRAFAVLSLLFAASLSGVASAGDVVANVDLALTIDDTPDPANPGAELTYTLEFANNGPDTATNPLLESILPDGVDYVSVTTTQGTCNPGTPPTEVVCQLGPVPSGGSGTVVIVTTVQADAAPGTILENDAVILPDVPGEVDTNGGNNLVTAETEVVAAPTTTTNSTTTTTTNSTTTTTVAPDSDVDPDATTRAPAAQPVTAQPTFTG